MADLKLSLYSEDASDSKQGLPVLSAIVKCALKLIHQDYKSNHVDVDPMDGVEQINGSYWKAGEGSGAQEMRRKIFRAIATDIRLNKFVVFHIDGDRPWSQRINSENAKSVQALIKDLIGSGLVRETDVADQFVVAMPFYSIESWAYSNIEYLKSICEGCDQDQIAIWEKDPRQLDEEEKPKEKLKIRDRYNRDLVKMANGFDPESLNNLGMSFAAFVSDLSKPEVKARLKKTADREY